MRSRPHAGCNNCAGFSRMAQPVLQGRVSAHARPNQMGALDVEATHQGDDVVYRELPAIQSRTFGNIARRIAAGIVGNATMGARKVTNLSFPTAEIRRELMDEDDRISATA